MEQNRPFTYGCRSLVLLLLLLLAWGCGSEGGKKEQVAGNDSVKARLEVLNRLIDKDKDNSDLYEKRARIYLNDKQVDLALKDVNKAISLDGKNPNYYITLSDIYLLMGQPDNCKESLSKAISLNPEGEVGLLRMAKLMLIMKDYKGCYESVRQLLLIDKNNDQAYYTRALALLEQGDTNRAIADLVMAADRNQEFYEAYVQLGELYALRKDPKTEAYLKNALNIRPASKEAMYMLGMYYQETEQYPRALAVYQNLAASDTTIRSAPYNMGYIYLVYLKDFPRAAALFTQAIERDPNYFEAYFNRGYAYELSGRYDEAYKDYSQALKIKVNYDKAIAGLNRLDKLRR